MMCISRAVSLYDSHTPSSLNTSSVSPSTCSIIDSEISVTTQENNKDGYPTDKQTAVTPLPIDPTRLHDEDEFEEILHASSLQTLDREEPEPGFVYDIGYLDTFFDSMLDVEAHDKLHKRLPIASKRFLDCHKTVYSPFAKRVFLSAEQRAALKDDLQQAHTFLVCLEQICKDLNHIQNEMDWIRLPVLTVSSDDTDQELALLPEDVATALLIQVESCIAQHTQNIDVLQTQLEAYLDHLKYTLEKHAPPRPGLADRVSVILTAFPSLLGGLGTFIAYVFGVTAALTLIPLAVGIATSCISLLFYVLSVSKFFPAEKNRQMTEEREALYTSVLTPVLDLLRKVKKMSANTVNNSSTAPDIAQNARLAYSMSKAGAERGAEAGAERGAAKANEPLVRNTTTLLQQNEEQAKKITALEEKVDGLTTKLDQVVTKDDLENMLKKFFNPADAV